jgi:hypothetical protein
MGNVWRAYVVWNKTSKVNYKKKQLRTVVRLSLKGVREFMFRSDLVRMVLIRWIWWPEGRSGRLEVGVSGSRVCASRYACMCTCTHAKVWAHKHIHVCSFCAVGCMWV